MIHIFFSLREKSKSNLSTELKDLMAELALLGVPKVTGGTPNKLSKMYVPAPLSYRNIRFIASITDVAFWILGFEYFKLLYIWGLSSSVSQYDLASEKRETLSAKLLV